jgi:hypothetical protein
MLSCHAQASAEAYIQSQRRNDTISLILPLMTINGHNRSEWMVVVTRARPLTLSVRFLRYVPTESRQPGSDPAISGITLRVPLGSRAID